MVTYYNDRYIKIEYDRTLENDRIEKLAVGTEEYTTLESLSAASNSNSIFVNTSTGNDSNDGTGATPKLTITDAWNSATSTNSNVVVVNTSDIQEDLTNIDNDLVTGLYSSTGATVRLITKAQGYTPSDSNSIYINATTGVSAPTWSATGSLNTARYGIAGCGVQSASLAIGGYNSGALDAVELYNGSTWSAVNGLNTSTFYMGACGIQSAAAAFGGSNGSITAATENYNGSSWSNSGNLNTKRYKLAGCGTQTAGLSFGGSDVTYCNDTEKYNGSTWTASGNLGTARDGIAGCGTQSAGLAMGGYTGGVSVIAEKFNGSTWSATGSINTGRDRLAAAGTQSAAICFGGYISTNSDVVEIFNGSTWATTTSLNTARHSSSGSGAKGSPLCGGGSIGTTPSAVTEKFSGIGYSSTPLDTVTHGIQWTDDDRNNLNIQDSETYTEDAFEFTGNFTGLYSTLGQIPTIQFTQNLTADTVTANAFNGGSTCDFPSAAALSNGNLVIAYQDESDSNYGKYTIVDSSASVVLAETPFEEAETDYIAVGVLSDDSIVIAYRDVGNSNRGTFVICDALGTIYDGFPKVFSLNHAASHITVGVRSDDSIVIAYRDDGESGAGKFRRYNSSGSAIDGDTAEIFESGSTYYTDITVLSDDDFVIVYSDWDDSYHGKFRRYNSSGTALDGGTPVVFESGGTVTRNKVCNLSNDDFIVCYAVDNYGYFRRYNSSGTAYAAASLFTPIASTSIIYKDICALPDDSFVIAYNHDAGVHYCYFTIFNSSGTLIKTATLLGTSQHYYINVVNTEDYDFAVVCDRATGNGAYYYSTGVSQSAITVSTAATINGIIFDGNDIDYLSKMFDATAALTLKNCDIINVSNPAGPTLTYGVYSTAAVDAQNCRFNNNGRGIYTEENTGTFIDNEFYNNDQGYALHVKGTAASPGAITIQNNTFFSNSSGLQLEDNNGTNEVVKNNIFASNDVYDIYAETTQHASYCDITGTTHNLTASTGCITLNPMFVSESDYDLNLMSTLCGDFIDSPCLDLSNGTSPDRDAGCHNVARYGAGETWEGFILRKPIKITIIRTPVGVVKNYAYDGTPYTAVTGWVENVVLDYDGVSVSDLANINTMLDSMTSDTTIRLYPDYLTYPTQYNTFRLVPDKVQISPSGVPQLSRAGAEKTKIILERKYS